MSHQAMHDKALTYSWLIAKFFQLNLLIRKTANRKMADRNVYKNSVYFFDSENFRRVGLTQVPDPASKIVFTAGINVVTTVKGFTIQ